MVNCLKMHYFATKDCFFKRFYKDQLANIHQHFWKEHLEPRTLTKLKGDTSKVNRDIAPESHDILQKVCIVGAETIQ